MMQCLNSCQVGRGLLLAANVIIWCSLMHTAAALECSSAAPLQFARQGVPEPIAGLGVFDVDASSNIEYGIQAQTGVIEFLRFDALEIRTLLDNRVVLRGTSAALNVALSAVDYTSCYDCALHEDTIEITCSIVAMPQFHQTYSWTQKSSATIMMQVLLQYPSPMVRAPKQHYEAIEDEVLVIRDVQVIDVKPGAILNITVTASRGTVAIRHDWRASSASITGSVDKLNKQLVLQGISYMGGADWSSDLCDTVVDLALVIFDMADPSRAALEHISLWVANEPDAPKVTTTDSTIVLENSLGLTRAHVRIDDVDHCCNALDQTNDASLAMVVFFKDAHVAITPSPYSSQALCEWSTADLSGRYLSDSSGWPTEVSIDYLEWWEPSFENWSRVDGLAGPESGTEVVTNHLPEPLYARKMRMRVQRFHGFPALRFEIFGCIDLTIDSWEVINGTSCQGAGLATPPGYSSLEQCKATCVDACRAVVWIEDAPDGVTCYRYTSCSMTENVYAELHLKRQPLRNSCPDPYPLAFAPVRMANFSHVAASSVQDSSYFSMQASIDGSSAWLARLGDPSPYIEVSFDSVVIVRSIAIGGDPRKTSLVGCLTCGPQAHRLLEPLTISRFDDFHGAANLHVHLQNLRSNLSTSGEVQIFVPPKVTNFVAPMLPFEMEEVVDLNSLQYVEIGSRLKLMDGSIGGNITVVCSPDGTLAWKDSDALESLTCAPCSLEDVRQSLSSLRYYPKYNSNGAKRIDIVISSLDAGQAQSEMLLVWVWPVNTAPVVRPCAVAATPGDGEVWFSVKEDVMEAPICMELEDDADEIAGNTVDLRVWVSHGSIHCHNSSILQPVFFTECSGPWSKPADASEGSCQLSTDPNMRPSITQAQTCLHNLVYTPPTNFHGIVDMLISVSDHGFSGADHSENVFPDSFSILNSPRGVRSKPLTTSTRATLSVTDVNDMPWLSWITLPPTIMYNNESLLLNGLSLKDVDSDALLPHEDSATFTLTIETLWGQIEAPSDSIAITIPAPPFQSRYIQLFGTVVELSIAVKSVLYRPQPWFVGEDVVRIRAADGGVTGFGGNLTSEIGFRMRVEQALAVPTISVAAHEFQADEDEPIWLEKIGLVVDLPSAVALLRFRLSSNDGALMPPMNKDKMNRELEYSGAPADSFQQYMSASRMMVEGIGTAAAVTHIIARTRFLVPQRHYSSLESPSLIHLEACLWDAEEKAAIEGTCARVHITVDVRSTRDAPVVYSANYPWAIPLRVLEDVPVQICCFSFRDADLEASSATYWPSGAPWPLAVILRVRSGSLTISVPDNVAIVLQNASFVHLEGRLPDLKMALDTLSYTPRHNMNTMNDGLDNICMFVADVTSTREYDEGRHYTGCWDVDIAPVNDPPVLSWQLSLPNGVSHECSPESSAVRCGRMRMDNAGGAEPSKMPLMKLDDVDAEDAELEGPAVKVNIRAELGSILKPDYCVGIEVLSYGPLAARGWELNGGLQVLKSCLGKLFYFAPSDTFEGPDTVTVQASDLGHSGTGSQEEPGITELRIPLDVVRVGGRIILEVPYATYVATEGASLNLQSLQIEYPPLLAGWHVIVSLNASGGVLELTAATTWLHEHSVTLRSPTNGSHIEWMSDVEIAATLLASYITYMSDVSGSFNVLVTLRSERSHNSEQFDHTAARPLRITVVSVNDAPVIQGPSHWKLMAGDIKTFSSVGITFQDLDAGESFSKIHTDALVGSLQEDSPDEHLGSDMRAISVLVRTTVGAISVGDWAGLSPVQPESTCEDGCSNVAMRVRPSLLQSLPNRLFLQTIPSDGGQVGDLQIYIDDRGLIGAGLNRLVANHSMMVNITHSNLPPSFQWLGTLDGPDASMYRTPHNTTRKLDANADRESTRMLNFTVDKDIGVRVIPVDGMHLREYTCTIEVPYGGHFELPNYKYGTLPTNFVSPEYWSGAGFQRILHMEGALADINVALHPIYFRPHPGFSGVAYLDVRVGSVGSYHTNRTHVPIYVERPDPCNMSIKVEPTLFAQGSMSQSIGDQIALTAYLERSEWRGQKIDDPTLFGNHTFQLTETPEIDCGPYTMELTLSQDDVRAPGRGILFLEDALAVDRSVIPDTLRSNGDAVVLHGNLSDMRRVLPHVLFRWLPDNGMDGDIFRADYSVTLHVHMYTSPWDPREVITLSSKIISRAITHPLGQEPPYSILALRMPEDDYDWPRTSALRVEEDSSKSICISVVYALPDEEQRQSLGREYRIDDNDLASDQVLVTREDTRDATDYNNMTLEVDVLHGGLQFTAEGIANLFARGVELHGGCYDLANCSRFFVSFDPIAFDPNERGNFSICMLNYFPDPDFNTAPIYGATLEERIRIKAGLPTINRGGYKYSWLHVPIHVKPEFDGLRLEPKSSEIMVRRGADITVKSLISVSSPDGDLDPSPRILNAPVYYPLSLKLSAGLYFETPLPAHCYNDQGLQWLPPSSASEYTARALFSQALSSRNFLNLSAPLASLQDCVDNLVVVVPFDTPITAPIEQYRPRGPKLKSIVPTNGSVTSQYFEVLLIFNDGLEAGDGMIEIHDCGADGACGMFVDTADDSVISISPHDRAQVEIDRNTLKIKPSKKLAPMHLHQMAITNGAVRDLSGRNYTGFSRTAYLFSVGMGTASPTGWRIVASAARNGTQPILPNTTWSVCDLSFFLTPGCPQYTQLNGTPVSSGTFVAKPPQFDPNPSVSRAFDSDLSTCWDTIANVPGSWIGQHYNEANLVRSFQIRAHAFAAVPDEISVQFYFEPFWYNLQTVEYNESCIEVTTDYQAVLGVEIDSTEPLVIAVEPPFGFEGIGPYPRVQLTFNENVQVVGGNIIDFVNAGGDTICGTSDDTFVNVSTTQASVYQANGSTPNVVALNNTVMITPAYQYLQGLHWHCLWIPRDVIRDVAGNAYTGLGDNTYRFRVGDPAHDVRTPLLIFTDPPVGGTILGEEFIKIRLFFNKEVVLSGTGDATFTPSIFPHNESFNISLTDTKRARFHLNFLDLYPGLDARLNETLRSGRQWTLSLTDTGIADTAAIPTPIPPHNNILNLPHIFGGITTAENITWYVAVNPTLSRDHRPGFIDGVDCSLPGGPDCSDAFLEASEMNAMDQMISAPVIAPLGVSYVEGPPNKFHAEMFVADDNSTLFDNSTVETRRHPTKDSDAGNWLELVTEDRIARVMLNVAPANSPAQIMIQDPVINGSSGVPSYLVGVTVEDDDAQELFVNVSFQPMGEIFIHRTAWETTGRVTNPPHTEPVSPNYGSAGAGDVTYLTGLNDISSVITFSGNSTQVSYALMNMTYTCNASFEGPAEVHITIRDGNFLSEGRLIMMISAPAAPLHMDISDEKPSTVYANEVQRLDLTGCDIKVSDGGIVTDTAFYSLKIYADECTEFYFNECGRHRPEDLASTCQPDLSAVTAGPVRSQPLVKSSSVLQINATGLKLLNHHLRALTWKPCSCPRALPSCTHAVNVFVVRVASGWNVEPETALNTCAVPVVVPLKIFAALSSAPLKTMEDVPLAISDRIHIRGHSPGTLTRLTLSALHGSILEPNVASSGKGPAMGFTIDAESVDALLPQLKAQNLRYVPFQHFFGLDTLEVRVESLISPALVGNIAELNSSGALVSSHSFEIEVQPVSDTPSIAFAGNDGLLNVIASGQANVGFTISHPDVTEDGMVHVRTSVSFGFLTFPGLEGQMDDPFGGIIGFTEDDEVETKQYLETPSGARYLQSGAAYTIVGTLATVRTLLTDVVYHAPADAPKTGMLVTEIKRTPTLADSQIDYAPGAFENDEVLAQTMVTIVVTPLTMPQYACVLRGPANIFITPSEANFPTENLGLLVDVATSPSVEISKRLAVAEFSFRVSVSNGTLEMVGAPIPGILQAPAVRVCPMNPPSASSRTGVTESCNPDESDAWMFFGTIEEASARLAAVSYVPPLGFVGRDLMYVSASCAAGVLPVTLSVARFARSPILECANTTLDEIELVRGASAMSVPPCIISDKYGDLPLVVRVRVSTTLGLLALESDAGLYFDNTEVVDKLQNISSHLQFTGPIAQIRRALSSKLILIHVPQNEAQKHGTLAVDVQDVRTNLSSVNTRKLHVVSDRLPNIYVELSVQNVSFHVGGQMGLEVGLPDFSVVSDLPDAPCMVELETPVGDIQPVRYSPGVAAAQWQKVAPGQYKLLGTTLIDANTVLHTLRYSVREDELSFLPKRVPLTIRVFALPLNSTAFNVDGVGGPHNLLMNAGGIFSKVPEPIEISKEVVLRDRKVMYLELQPEPYKPEIHISKTRWEVWRNHKFDLSELELQLEYARPLAMKLECSACSLTDDTIDFGRRHEAMGSATALVQALRKTRVTISCASCDSDELVITAWDPVALENYARIYSPREVSTVGIPPNHFTRKISVKIAVVTSPQAQETPYLSILSKGFVAIAGMQLELKDVASLQSVDPQEPLGLRAIEKRLDVKISCDQGHVAIDATSLVGAGTQYIEDNSTLAPMGRRADGSFDPVDYSHRAVSDPLYKSPPNANLSDNETSLYNGFVGSNIIWRGASVHLRGLAVQISEALASLTYTPYNSAGGEDFVKINVDQRTDSIPVYVRRKVPENSIIVAPLLNITAGQPLQPGISVELSSLLRPDDALDVHIACGRCRLAMWPLVREIDAFEHNLSFTAKAERVNVMLSNLTYLTDAADSGFDRLSIEVRTQRLQAVGNREGASVARASTAILIRAAASFAPKVNLSLPREISLKEDTVIDPRIIVEGMDSVIPSGISLATQGGNCFRVNFHEAFVMEIASPSPCDLFLQAGGSSSATKPCDKCMLRSMTYPDQCVTWSSATIAASQQRSEGWMLAACREVNGVVDSSQAFETSSDPREFCLQTNECIFKVGMTVSSQLYSGVPTYTYEPNTLSCNQASEMISFGSTVDQRCAHSLRCEYHINVADFTDPAPGCDKEVVSKFTCPNGVDYEVRTPFPYWEKAIVTTVLQCPVVLIPSQTNVAMRGGLRNGSFLLRGWKTLRHLRRLADCSSKHDIEHMEPKKCLSSALGAPSSPLPRGVVGDYQPPSVVLTEPCHHDLVSPDVKISLIFSEDITTITNVSNALTLTLVGANNATLSFYVGGPHLQLDRNLLVLSPSVSLPAGMVEVTVARGAVFDLHGNAFGGIKVGEFDFFVVDDGGLTDTPQVRTAGSSSVGNSARHRVSYVDADNARWTEKELRPYIISLKLLSLPSDFQILLFLEDALSAGIDTYPWVGRRDDTGQLFFYNTVTLAESRKHPYESTLQDLANACRHCLALTSGARVNCVEVQQGTWNAEAKASAAGWVQKISQSNQEEYFHRPETSETASYNPVETITMLNNFRVIAFGWLLEDNYCEYLQGSHASSLALMMEAVPLKSFCVVGPPFALAEFATELRYQPASDFVGHEPLKIAIVDPQDPQLTHAATQTWMHVEDEVDTPTIHASQDSSSAVVGETIKLSGVELDDADNVDGTRWMTLAVSATNGNIYIDPSHLIMPHETLKPFSRLDGTPTLKIQGSLVALKGLLASLLYGQPAPIKPFLNLRPLSEPKETVFVTYIVSDSVEADCQAFTMHSIAGSVTNPANGHAVDTANVIVTGVNGFSKTETTSPQGTFALIVPEGPVKLVFSKFNYETVVKELVVTDTIQAGGVLNTFMPQRAVITLWRVILSWTSRTHKVDLDAHAFDAWKCHTYFALRQCDHPIDFGLTVSLSSDQRGKLYGQEAITFLARPCDATLAADGTYGEIYSCKAQYWVQMFSRDTFADVNASVAVYRGDTLVHNVDLPHSGNASHAYWVGLELDFATHSVSKALSSTGDVGIAEALLNGQELPPGRSLRALDKGEAKTFGRSAWLEQVFNESNVKDSQENTSRRLSASICDPSVTGFLHCPGYACNGSGPYTCWTVCGDARRAGSESCDDGNAMNGDGCSSSCHIEPGFVCDGGTPYVPDHCYPICGDGKRIYTEACDDGNTMNGDGCSSTCAVETGFACYGGNNNATDTCRRAVCGDGVVEGAEQCDDYNNLGGDGCSSSCMIEAAPASLASEAKISIEVYSQPQACRITNAASHTTSEDTIYHLQNTIITGDVATPDLIKIAVNVKYGVITLQPLVDQWAALDKTDAVPTALVRRETGVELYPFSLTPRYTVLSGTVENIDRFLRYFLYIQPDKDFAGYVVVDFTMVEGIVLGPDAVVCSASIPILVTPVYDDAPQIHVSVAMTEVGHVCTEMSAGCQVEGITVSDADCSQVVDGSCYERLSVNVSIGSLSVAGMRYPWNYTLTPMEGHPPGLNAALASMKFIPPARLAHAPGAEDQRREGIIHVMLERIVSRTDATPATLMPTVIQSIVKVTVLPLDSPPTIRLSSGEAFHGTVFRVTGGKPFRIRNLVLEGPGASDTETVVVRLEVSKGAFWLVNREGIWFENNTAQGEPILQFRAQASLMRTLYLSEVAYSWYDEDCQNLEEFKITVSNERLPSWTASAFFELPECDAFTMTWDGGTVQLQEDTQAKVSDIKLFTNDEDVFLVLDVRHPPGILGDCQLVFWPDRVNTFVPGRECHMDGLVSDLQAILPNITYRPPPDFVGTFQLEVVATRRVPEEIVAGAAPKANPPSKTIYVDVEVLPHNDGPVLEIEQESISIDEDTPNPVPLSPMFLSDIDSSHHPVHFKIEIISGHELGDMHMCALQRVDSEYLPRLNTASMLDAQGCLLKGRKTIEFNASVQYFNWMQSSPGRPGRLHFLPASNRHGPVQISITVDDLGSGQGIENSKTYTRLLYVYVEPVVDKPNLMFTCGSDLPFISYGRVCLEVRECIDLTAGADEQDEDTTMWLSISASDPGVSVSLSDRASVHVYNNGGSAIRASGIYADVKETLRTLIIRPPATLFRTAYDPDTFEFSILVEVAALGHMFNEPMPIASTTNEALPIDFRKYPSDSVSFSVVYRRVNRGPDVFVETSHFSSSQAYPTLDLPGISVRDPDARADDQFNVTLQVDAKTQGGALVFDGVENVLISKVMSLTELNQKLKDLSFTFQDNAWFGVTGFTVQVSDLGNRGWVLEQYEDMYHGDTHPQVLSLRDGVVYFVPEDVEKYHRLYSADFTWESYVKRWSIVGDVNSTSESTIFQNFRPMDNFTGPSSTGTNASEAFCSLTINADGFPVVSLNSKLFHNFGGVGRTLLKAGGWYHLAIVVRRFMHVALQGVGYDATIGEVALYVNAELDTAWPLESGRVDFGTPTHDGVLVSIGGGMDNKQSGLSFSRARIWARALQPGELGACGDPLSPVGGGAEGAGQRRPSQERVPNQSPPEDVDGFLTSRKHPGDADAGGLAFSFSFIGTLAETRQRAAVHPTGSWSFEVDAPPTCSSLVESPYDNVFEHCACYDSSLASTLESTAEGVPYVWHSPQAYSGVALDMKAYAKNRVLGVSGQGLNASMFFAVYRSFVNEAPALHILEPANGHLQTLEDNPTYVSLAITHKAHDQLVGRPFHVTLSVSHGFVRTISAAAVVKMVSNRRSIEYRAMFFEINDFLAQLEYIPDPNYSGDDVISVVLTDFEFTVNVTISVVILPLSDPLTLVCPPAVDMMEGDRNVLIGGNISVFDHDVVPGTSDSEVPVAVEMFVGDGGLRLNVADSMLRFLTKDTALYDGTGSANTEFMNSPGWLDLVDEATELAPTIRFNCTLGELRAFLNALSFTPSPVLFHGVVHFGLFISVLNSGEEASCDIGLTVHPVNTAPKIHVDQARMLALKKTGTVTNNTFAVNADEDVLLGGVLKLSDPDEEDFYDWFTRRTMSARLSLHVTCGSLSWDLYRDSDYVYGVQHGSIAGKEGLTFHNGDGYKDPFLNVTSTLDHLNGQLHRLYYHSYACASQEVTLSVELDDLGNYGSGLPLVVTSAIVFDVLP